MNKKIRNFAIIAHIDHGKTTLTDRLLEITGAEKADHQRVLDSHPIEQERGVTIKLAPVTLSYQHNNQDYQLNLIDTPGHIDFNYEVERSLAACEGALLLVDASQGIQAQTITNLELAKKQDLEIIPIINKVDLQSAQVEATKKSLQKLIPQAPEPLLVSAKTGKNANKVLSQVVQEVPAPKGEDKPLRALVFNSVYDQHLGVVAFVRIVDGSLSQPDKLKLLQTKQDFTATQIGIFTPQMTETAKLSTGQVGYIATGLKDIKKVKVGETITLYNQNPEPLPGYRTIVPNVYLELYPQDNARHNQLRSALSQIELHDAALSIAPTSSPALGHGFRVGFLGLFHADIIKDRLKQDFDLDVTLTSPSVKYLVNLQEGTRKYITRPSQYPDPSKIDSTKEPMAQVTVISPDDYLGLLIQLLETLRGTMEDTQYINPKTVKLTYKVPLIEVITHLHDNVKTVSSGFASVDYKPTGYQEVNLLKLEVLLNKESVEPLARLEVEKKAESTARELAKKLKEIIPRHQFEVPIQIKVGGKIIARETKPAVRKNVTAKLYGGDRTRRMKLLENQKAGKKKLQRIGSVNLPPEAFKLDV